MAATSFLPGPYVFELVRNLRERGKKCNVCYSDETFFLCSYLRRMCNKYADHIESAAKVGKQTKY